MISMTNYGKLWERADWRLIDRSNTRALAIGAFVVAAVLIWNRNPIVEANAQD